MQILSFKDLNSKIIFIFFMVLPAAIIAGSAISNTIILLINILFIFEITKEKKLNYLNNKLFFSLILIWCCLLMNSIIIAKDVDSLIRSFGFLRFILLVFSFKYFFEKEDNNFKNNILKIWFIIFLIVSVDILIEFTSGSNILGFSSELNGRIASFTDDELKIGNYYFGFILLSLSFFYKNYFKKHQIFFYILLLLFMVISFLIGERSNFIKVFIICSIFIFLIDNQNYLKKIMIISLFFLISYTTILNKEFYKSRIIDEIIVPMKQNGISNFIYNSRYGKHFEIAKKIYLNNSIFGVGIKKYRSASKLPIYNKNKNLDASTTHPHQIHYEFLSETGLVGYLIFIIFFTYSIIFGLKKFFKYKNPYVLTSSLFILATAMPLIPSGSFFTSYGATIFWINYSFLFMKDNNN